MQLSSRSPQIVGPLCKVLRSLPGALKGQARNVGYVSRVDVKGKKKADGRYMQSELCNYKWTTKYMSPRTSSSKRLGSIWLLMSVSVAFCQGVNGQILGSVKDSSKAVVSNAVVTVTNQ